MINLIKYLKYNLKLIAIISLFSPLFSITISNAQNSNLDHLKAYKIAVLPAHIYNPDLSAFEKVNDLASRYTSISYKFSLSNNINHIITNGVSFATQDYYLFRNELLDKIKIDENRYLNPKIYYIDIKEILNSTGQPSITPAIEEKFMRFAKLSGVNIILNKAIYSSEKANITKKFLEYIKNESVTLDFLLQPQNSICIINVQALYNSDYYKNFNQQNSPSIKIEFNKIADKIISDFSKNNNIDIVIESNPASSLCNITSNVINNFKN